MNEKSGESQQGRQNGTRQTFEERPSRINHSLESKKTEAITLEELKSLRGQEFLEKSIEYFRASFEATYLRGGIDLSGYSLENLRVIDHSIIESAARICSEEGIPLDSGILWSVYHGVGSYFGTVIVRNLGGRWRTPSTLRFWLSHILGRPGILFDHWYVELKGERIPVFKIARWRCDGSGRVPSLAKAYEKIASGRSWSE